MGRSKPGVRTSKVSQQRPNVINFKFCYASKLTRVATKQRDIAPNFQISGGRENGMTKRRKYFEERQKTGTE